MMLGFVERRPALVEHRLPDSGLFASAASLLSGINQLLTTFVSQ